MELRQMRYFVAVAEELHFGRAARRLHMTQPPLSQQIGALEREIGTALLLRDKRHVELTDAGRVFLERARQILAEANDAKVSAIEAAAGNTGQLYLGCNAYARWWPAVETILRTIEERSPSIRIELLYRTSGTLLRMLQSGQLDMALVIGPVRDFQFDRVKIASERYFVALAAEHPLARRTSVQVQELGGGTLLLFSRELAPEQYDQQLAIFSDEGRSVEVREAPAETSGLLGAVAAGLGFGLLPRPIWPYPGAALRPLGPPPKYVDLNLVWRRVDRSAMVSTVVRLVEELQREGPLEQSL